MASLSWSLDLTGTELSVVSVGVLVTSSCFGDGKVVWVLCGDNDVVLLTPGNQSTLWFQLEDMFQLIQGDKKSTQQGNYGKTTHFVHKYSCWLPQGIRGDLDFSHTYHFFTSTCAQWANLFFQGRKFEIDLRDKQKQI